MLFERICDSYGVRVHHYHTDNGMFDTNKFKKACNTEKIIKFVHEVKIREARFGPGMSQVIGDWHNRKVNNRSLYQGKLWKQRL